MSHPLCIETYLRLTWPFILGQAILLFFLGTGQGYEIVLSHTNTLADTVIFLVFVNIFTWLVWMLTRTVISVAPNLLYGAIRDPDAKIKARARFYCFHLPCITSVWWPLFLGWWLSFASDRIWALPVFGIFASLLPCVVLWYLPLSSSFATAVRWFFIVASPALFLLAAFLPVPVGGFFGALGSYNIAFIGFLFLMAVAALLLISFYPRHSAILWTISLLVAFYLIPRGVVWALGIVPHEIRCAESCNPIAEFPFSVDQAIERWNARKHPSDTMIVVAAAGGGARAGYWTASVLGSIQDSSKGNFAGQLFAISGVSGGALGGAAFAALGTDHPTCQVNGQENHSFRDCLRAFLSYDFLSPVMTSALTGDLAQAFTGIPFPDRASALEQSWETAWGRTFSGTNWMEEAFDERWRKDRTFHENVFLNGTIADAGKPPDTKKFPSLRPGERAVTSNLLLMQNLDAGETPIANPAERREISLSTAIDNSTRFPFVEPLGAVLPPNSNADTPTYYVADGGYYDNYGAATLLDLLRLVDKQKDKLAIKHLVIIQISSNSQVSFKLDREPPKPEATGDCLSKDESGGTAGGVMAAYRTAMAAREWSGLAYAMELRALKGSAADLAKPRTILKDLDINYFHFGMHDIDPPLGWSLSEISRGCIDALFNKDGYTDQEIGRLVSLLDEH